MQISTYKLWMKLSQRIGLARLTVVTILLVSGVFGFTVTVLGSFKLDHSGLLYVLVPYCISLIIAWTRPYRKSRSLLGAYGKHVLSTLIVFLATSIILREGFICVLFFLPIYLVFASLAFLVYRLVKPNTLFSSAIPILVCLLSLEGTTQSLTLPRDIKVVAEQEVALSLEAARHNMSKPIALTGDRHWILDVFPMPYEVEAGSLNEGDIHTVKTRYQRWFFTNTHTGDAEIEIVSVTPQHVSAKVVADSTYFSNYLAAQEINIYLTPINAGLTNVRFEFEFERKLDPAWYFDPLQRFAAEKMAYFTIQEVIARGH